MRGTEEETSAALVEELEREREERLQEVAQSAAKM